MNYAKIKRFCASNGPGVRTAVYLSGCDLHCKGCFNPELWDFDYGQELTDEVITEILDSIEPDYIRGLSILGGEPFDGENVKSCQRIVDALRERYGHTKDIWVWSGHLLEFLLRKPENREVLSKVDAVVDGPFLEDQANKKVKFAGSDNQRLLYRGKDF